MESLRKVQSLIAPKYCYRQINDSLEEATIRYLLLFGIILTLISIIDFIKIN